MPLCLSQFSKSENGGENLVSSPQIPFFGILRKAGGGPELVQNIINFRIFGNVFL